MEVSYSIGTRCSICICMETGMTIIGEQRLSPPSCDNGPIGLDGVMACMSHHPYIESTDSLTTE